ncbi:uncharacterized protein F5Z01DRAFT_27814 [Emericellopsis atlantica]|uniref:Protein HGH1 homolog n=1 Tax=Emericellopsis atlantica TaxID=2614577 RepID=A0A9P7ZVT6_9HYPO|nr:uncharacterized protein F5Z01DRAFT_27814 [Emericellopsis atlantica]KAG9259165.1 hypothetical protein F5Z01DRAFT_27814 [Emericellopsis atlantica]
MPTELEELVGFIASPNPQIRKLAVENLVPYSTSDPSIFKANDNIPIRNLRVLVRDHPKIAEHALTMLINLSGEDAVQEMLATDEKFLELLFQKIVNAEEPNANLLAMLLANLTKSAALASIDTKKQPSPEDLSKSHFILDQLMDLFVKGQDGTYNKHADYDYLAYCFADLAKHESIRKYFLTKQEYDDVVPLSKLLVFTEHKSEIRRKGVASTIKNVAFEVHAHPELMSDSEIGILTYVLLPIMGSEEYDVDESMDMLPDLQLLPPDKKREPDNTIIVTHLDTLMLLTTTRKGRELMREVKVYPIVRETHARVQDADVKEACDRLVQVLMRDEEGEGEETERKIQEVVDEEDEIVEV